ncbi:MAG: 16S rRNA (adenine(1518)-N(6)/adenine(1519)-N(6))-dimethyltransferase RsmA [Anaerolineaceae bacterium]
MSLPPLNIPALLKRHHLEPRKSLGQNFLVSEEALARIVAAAEVNPDATVLEVGAGLGSLTRVLARAASRVVAVELDRNLIPILKEVVGKQKNVEVVQGDMLELNPGDLIKEAGYLVVANIPYYITSSLIRHLIETGCKPARMVLTIQKEVAERVCATPGDMSLLALGVQVYGSPRLVMKIAADDFYPSPKVDSAVVRVDLYPQPVIPFDKLDLFFRLAKAGFSQKRKTLRNSISAGMHMQPAEAVELLGSAGIDPQRRAETLSLEEWRGLTEHME